MTTPQPLALTFRQAILAAKSVCLDTTQEQEDHEHAGMAFLICALFGLDLDRYGRDFTVMFQVLNGALPVERALALLGSHDD